MAKKKAPSETESEVKIERTSREVKIDLTEAEVNHRRDEAADASMKLEHEKNALAEVTAKAKEDKKVHKDEIKILENTISTKLTEVREKKARALVELDEVQNFTTKKVEYFYPNYEAGKKVDERDFTPEEHQMRMFKEKAESIPSTGSNPIDDEREGGAL